MWSSDLRRRVRPGKLQTTDVRHAAGQGAMKRRAFAPLAGKQRRLAVCALSTAMDNH